MRKSFILLLAFFLCVTGYAQKLTISGVVIDKDLNEPLTGVNVLVKGTTTGTITDFDGKYTLEADANSILVFSYLSMKTIEEPVNGRTKIDVTMVSDAEALDEVVVTAMGIKRESKTLTYSAQTVGGKDLNEIKNVNMINSLQGKSAGLQITPNSTGAGGSSKILFRGNKSISGSNQPLIVVDGVRIKAGSVLVAGNDKVRGKDMFFHCQCGLYGVSVCFNQQIFAVFHDAPMFRSEDFSRLSFQRTVYVSDLGSVKAERV